jgi:hypothetical protein
MKQAANGAFAQQKPMKHGQYNTDRMSSTIQTVAFPRESPRPFNAPLNKLPKIAAIEPHLSHIPPALYESDGDMKPSTLQS